jgi:hypothetical protein
VCCAQSERNKPICRTSSAVLFSCGVERFCTCTSADTHSIFPIALQCLFDALQFAVEKLVCLTHCNLPWRRYLALEVGAPLRLGAACPPPLPVLPLARRGSPRPPGSAEPSLRDFVVLPRRGPCRGSWVAARPRRAASPRSSPWPFGSLCGLVVCGPVAVRPRRAACRGPRRGSWVAVRPRRAASRARPAGRACGPWVFPRPGGGVGSPPRAS